jgi:hypothetical protein
MLGDLRRHCEAEQQLRAQGQAHDPLKAIPIG